MMKSFYDRIEDAIGSSITENGAVGYKSSGHALLDLNFAVSSLRNAAEEEIVAKFRAAWDEDRCTAAIWLFFCRDARQGMGERRFFRVCLRWLASNWPETAKLVPLIAEYGRWDDVLCLLETPLHHEALKTIARQLENDFLATADEPISLLAKWLPSECSRKPEMRRAASYIMSFIGWTPRKYRKNVARLRQKLDIVERKMSAGEWGQIEYEEVPSRANLIYGAAFLRHDNDRRQLYLQDVHSGEKKINASVLFPHDIVHKYRENRWAMMPQYDDALEALWNALPNTIREGGSTIVVCDGSGSMACRVGETTVTAADVADALAIYFSERLPKPWKDKYITFSTNPQFVDLSKCGSLRDKLEEAALHNECSNTNVEAVFDLLLEVAVRNRLRQEDLPDNVLILSDMEFDSCVRGKPDWPYHVMSPSFSAPLFKTIEDRWKAKGYVLPRLVFWNIMSRTGTIPIKENEMGVALVSGFSPNVAKMVMSAKLDPMDALMDTLNSPRYDAVREALNE